MEKTLLEWKASEWTTSRGKMIFIIASLFFILTLTGSIFGFFLAAILSAILVIPKKCQITNKKVRFWFKKSKWSEIDRVVWEGNLARVYKSKWRHFILPVKEELVPKVKKILARMLG